MDYKIDSKKKKKKRILVTVPYQYITLDVRLKRA